MNLLNQYEKFKEMAPAGLESLRLAGIEFLKAHGLPNRKDEDWKYTSTKEIQESEFTPALLIHEIPNHDLLAKVRGSLNSQFTNIVFINGNYSDLLSESLPSGVHLQAVHSGKSEFADGFEALNAAYAEKLWSLTVDKNSSIEQPINIVHFVDSAKKIMTHSRLVVELGMGSSLKLIESFSGVGSYFSNSKTDIILAENSNLKFVHLQTESLEASNIARTHVGLKAGAHLDALSFASGGKLARHSLVIDLLGSGATAIVNGATVAQGSQHMDHNTSINHHVGHCDTSQLYKGILGGESRSVFNGRVYIAKDAQKANSEQLNNNLLLSNKAEADSKPMLEIYADDVKAGHGSTVGQLNKDELFYLQSRCISKNDAVTMLSYGFISELILRIDDTNIQSWLQSRLHSSFSTLKLEV